MTESSVPALATAILDPERRHPIIVVTTPGYTDPDRIPQVTVDEAEELRRAVGDIADVAIVATGGVSFTLEALLPDHWHIFNGFCRSYPAGILADPAVRRSPLRRRKAGEVASEQVISDALGHAHASGVLDEKPKGSVAATGTVKGFLLDGEQALIDIGAVMPAVIWRDMTSPGIPLDWLIAKGATLPGVLDRDYNRFLLRKPSFGAPEFRIAFPHHTVTLALVDQVTPDGAVLRVHPDLAITIDRSDVTSNPLDVLDLFLVEGEVVRVRAVHLPSGKPHLRLSDIDEDEPVRDALAVVEGGTPWLIEGRNVPAVIDGVATDEPLPPPESDEPPVIDETTAESTKPIPAPPRPTPGPGTRPAAPFMATAPTEAAPSTRASESKTAVHDMSLKITALTSEIERLRREAATANALDQELDLTRRTLRDTRAELATARDGLNNFKDLHKKAVDELRKARRNLSAPAVVAGPRDRRDAWPSDESWLRNEILRAWTERVQAAEKPSLPLPTDYVIGPGFPESLSGLDNGQFDKAMRTIVDVLLDRAKDIPGRDLHRLRTGGGGDDAYRVRLEDGAQAWRAAIEIKSASARRLHYWVLDGRIELSRVVLHDDMEA